MTPLVLRLLVLVAIGGGAWIAAGWWQRRRGAIRLPLAAGVTLVTGPGCALCGPVERALRRAGVQPRVTEVGSLDLPGPPIRSLPVALVVDGSGRVLLRRSGRAALDDVASIAQRAATL